MPRKIPSKKKRRNRPQSLASDPLNVAPLLPQEIARINKVCDCGNIVTPELWKDLGSPQGPIESAHVPLTEGAWIKIAVEKFCSCGRKITFDLPDKKLSKTGVFYFGDEADREFDGYFLHSYSMLGASGGPRKSMEKRLIELKRDYVPHLLPENWQIHATKLLNGKERPYHFAYKKLSKNEARSLLIDAAGIIKDHEKWTWNCHISTINKLPKPKKESQRLRKRMKAHAHVSLLGYSMFNTTKQGERPVYTFDAVKKVKSYPHIENWAFESFENSKNYLAHIFLTHNNLIAMPTFVKPASKPCLELADIHAYAAANTIYRRYFGKEPEIPIKEFGKFSYLSIKSSSYMAYHIGNNIPDDFSPKKN